MRPRRFFAVLVVTLIHSAGSKLLKARIRQANNARDFANRDRIAARFATRGGDCVALRLREITGIPGCWISQHLSRACSIDRSKASQICGQRDSYRNVIPIDNCCWKAWKRDLGDDRGRHAGGLNSNHDRTVAVGRSSCRRNR